MNLQIFAVIPALFTTYSLYRLLGYLLGVLASRRIYSTAGVHSALRRTLRDIERLLTLAPRLPPTASSTTAAPLPPPSSSSSSRLAGLGVLDERGLGRLVCLIAEFQNTVRINAPRLEAGVRRTIEEDLSDLLTGRQTVDQQLASLSRIRRSYGFLQVRSAGPLFELIT